MTKPTKSVCAQQRHPPSLISLHCPVWSESSLSTWRKLGSLATHWVHSEDSDQTGWMSRLSWVFAGRTLTMLVLSCRGSVVNLTNKSKKISSKTSSVVFCLPRQRSSSFSLSMQVLWELRWLSFPFSKQFPIKIYKQSDLLFVLLFNVQVNNYVVVVCSGLTLLSITFQSYHDNVWLQQGAQCSLL